MRDHLLLYINGQPIRVTGSDAFLTLAEFLRRRSHLTGTKVVCNEGDCGACATLIGRASADGAGIEYASVTSCIQLMFQLDAAHVITVEGLQYGEQLSPLQSAMVNAHGAQCGFCTPGFVVSLYDLMQTGRAVDSCAVRRGLVGNLCRCTGYDSIIKAAAQTDRTELKSLDTLYPPAVMLGDFVESAGQELRIETPGALFYRPATIEQAVRFRRQNPSCLIVAGATDLGVQHNKGTRPFNIVMSIAGLPALSELTVFNHVMSIGAAVTLSELERTCAEALPEFSRFLAWFGSPLVKNSATLGGNLVNASPIGDTLPPLMVLNAELELTGPAGTRGVNINGFYTGYRKTVLAQDELLTRVLLSLPEADDAFKLYKVSKRKDLDISSFSAAFWMRLAADRIGEIRVALGGVGPIVMRLPRTEAFLAGKPFSREVFEQAGELAQTEVSPISDVRGSEEYRRLLTGNIFLKFWNDLDNDSQLCENLQPADLQGGAP